MAVSPDLVALLDPPEVEFERSPLEPSGFIDSAEIQRLRAISYINAARGALAFVADCLRTDPGPGGDANLDAWVALFDANANAAGDCIADLRALRDCAGQA